MRALLIDPFTRQIALIPELGAGLQAKYEVIGCRYVEAVRLDARNLLWVDEDGLLKPPAARAYFRINGKLVANKGLVLGVTPTGRDTNAPLTVDALSRAVSWADVDEARQASLDGAFDGFRLTGDDLQRIIFRPQFG